MAATRTRVIEGLLGGLRAATTCWNQASLSRPGHLRSYGFSPQMLLDGSKPSTRRSHCARLLGPGRSCNARSFRVCFTDFTTFTSAECVRVILLAGFSFSPVADIKSIVY